MNHLAGYLEHILSTEGPAGTSHAISIEAVASEFVSKRILNFDNAHAAKALLLGEVQSGKTSQIIGILAATQDASALFNTFLLLTSDNVSLYQQTFRRAMECLPGFEVCGEADDVRFAVSAGNRPVLIVLKKNAHVLKRWRDTLSREKRLEGRPLFIVDDEADATSLNTRVNSAGQSTINQRISQIQAAFASSVFLQVTATPQALFLQASASGWKPEECICFDPGDGYLGGSFFFSDPPPYAYKEVDPNELVALDQGWVNGSDLPDGLRHSFASYLVAAADRLLSGSQKTSFLIHPSWSQEKHQLMRDAAEDAVKFFSQWDSFEEARIELSSALFDLQSTKPDLLPLDEVLEWIGGATHHIQVLNSSDNGSSVADFQTGSNILIGGNSLGRGLTFPMLLTTYYCRSTRIPQMDTIWQHCRMFGYDRDAALSRMFVSDDLYENFSQTYQSSRVLMEMVRTGGVDKLQVLSVGALRPTRRAVVDQSLFEQIVGGVNYFPTDPDQINWSAQKLDTTILDEGMTDRNLDISIEDLLVLMAKFRSDTVKSWSAEVFESSVKTWRIHRRGGITARLLIRVDRNVSRGTGTLLSPNDRQEVDIVRDRPVLVLYRLNGKVENKWDGIPFWIPNMKMPDGYIFNMV